MTPMTTFPPEIVARMRATLNASFRVRERMDRHPMAVGLARTFLESFGEVVLLLAGRPRSLAGEWRRVPDLIAAANGEAAFAECAHEVVRAIDVFADLPPPSHDTSAQRSKEENRVPVDRHQGLLDALSRFDLALRRTLRRRYVHLAPGDWVRDPHHLGKVLAVGDACDARIYLFEPNGPNSAGRCFDLLLPRFERADRPDPLPLVLPGRSLLNRARTDRWEIARATGGRPLRTWALRQFVERITTGLFLETRTDACRPPTSPEALAELPLGAAADAQRLLLELAATESSLDLRPDGTASLDEAAHAVLLANVDRVLDLFEQVVAEGVDRQLPARIRLRGNRAATLLRRLGRASWFAEFDEGRSRDVDLEEIVQEDGSPPSTEGALDMALMDAAQRGELGEVRRLLDEGAAPDAADDNGTTALWLAVVECRLDVATLLLERGASVDGSDAYDRRTPLLLATCGGDLPMASLLLAHGADPNAEDDYEETALVCAAGHGHLELVKLLLDHGADPTRTGELDRTPREEALASGHMEVAALLEEAERQWVDEKGP